MSLLSTENPFNQVHSQVHLSNAFILLCAKVFIYRPMKSFLIFLCSSTFFFVGAFPTALLSSVSCRYIDPILKPFPIFSNNFESFFNSTRTSCISSTMYNTAIILLNLNHIIYIYYFSPSIMFSYFFIYNFNNSKMTI